MALSITTSPPIERPFGSPWRSCINDTIWKKNYVFGQFLLMRIFNILLVSLPWCLFVCMAVCFVGPVFVFLVFPFFPSSFCLLHGLFCLFIYSVFFFLLLLVDFLFVFLFVYIPICLPAFIFYFLVWLGSRWMNRLVSWVVFFFLVILASGR